MSTALKILRRENTGVVYASPTKPDLTVRFRSTSANKTLNGAMTANYLTEVITNDSNAVVVGGVNAVDPISIRLRVSAAKESKARVAVLLAALALQYATWEGEGVFQGFDPETAPAI